VRKKSPFSSSHKIAAEPSRGKQRYCFQGGVQLLVIHNEDLPLSRANVQPFDRVGTGAKLGDTKPFAGRAAWLSITSGTTSLNRRRCRASITLNRTRLTTAFRPLRSLL